MPCNWRVCIAVTAWHSHAVHIEAQPLTRSICRRTLLGSFYSLRAGDLFDTTLAFLEASFVHIIDPRRSKVILADDIVKSVEPWRDIRWYYS